MVPKLLPSLHTTVSVQPPFITTGTKSKKRPTCLAFVMVKGFGLSDLLKQVLEVTLKLVKPQQPLTRKPAIG